MTDVQLERVKQVRKFHMEFTYQQYCLKMKYPIYVFYRLREILTKHKMVQIYASPF